MRELRQGLTALVAIFAITLHSLLLALTPPIAVASADGFDPYSIICLSGHDAGTRGDPAAPATQPNCQQCVMCVAPVLAGADAARLVWQPALAGRIETPFAAPHSTIIRHGPKLPRGPPLTV
jgi:hypothetical protein